jgi:manganese efflux pump family protein
MDYVTILAIALGLSFDTFAVSLSYGVIQNKILIRQASGIAFVFAIFQGGMAIGGYFAGSLFSEALESADHWIALGLLSFVGTKMIIEGIKNKEFREVNDSRNTLKLLAIAFGTSIDALAVGISFALLNIFIWEIGIVIGLVTFLASMTAIRIGKAVSTKLGQRFEIIGGFILIAIGLRIFIEHILLL